MQFRLFAFPPPLPYRYIDPDVETSPASIVYSPRGVPNGAFYLTDRPDVQVIFNNWTFHLDIRDESSLFTSA
jgi:hypothetical protein